MCIPLGVIAYEALTGALPIVANNDLQLAALRVSARARSFDEAAPGHGVPPELEAIVQRALQLNPNDRQQTALQFALELKAAFALSPQPITSGSVTPPPMPASVTPPAPVAADTPKPAGAPPWLYPALSAGVVVVVFVLWLVLR